jgi:hypothetical protein
MKQREALGNNYQNLNTQKGKTMHRSTKLHGNTFQDINHMVDEPLL